VKRAVWVASSPGMPRHTTGLVRIELRGAVGFLRVFWRWVGPS